MKAEYPLAFINGVLRDFNNKTIPPVTEEDEYFTTLSVRDPKEEDYVRISKLSSKWNKSEKFPVKIPWIHKQQIQNLNQMDHEED